MWCDWKYENKVRVSFVKDRFFVGNATEQDVTKRDLGREKRMIGGRQCQLLEIQNDPKHDILVYELVDENIMHLSCHVVCQFENAEKAKRILARILEQKSLFSEAKKANEIIAKEKEHEALKKQVLEMKERNEEMKEAQLLKICMDKTNSNFIETVAQDSDLNSPCVVLVHEYKDAKLYLRRESDGYFSQSEQYYAICDNNEVSIEKAKDILLTELINSKKQSLDNLVTERNKLEAEKKKEIEKLVELKNRVVTVKCLLVQYDEDNDDFLVQDRELTKSEYDSFVKKKPELVCANPVTMRCVCAKDDVEGGKKKVLDALVEYHKDIIEENNSQLNGMRELIKSEHAAVDRLSKRLKNAGAKK